jgi:hypothetical protein
VSIYRALDLRECDRATGQGSPLQRPPRPREFAPLKPEEPGQVLPILSGQVLPNALALALSLLPITDAPRPVDSFPPRAQAHTLIASYDTTKHRVGGLKILNAKWRMLMASPARSVCIGYAMPTVA